MIKCGESITTVTSSSGWEGLGWELEALEGNQRKGIVQLIR